MPDAHAPDSFHADSLAHLHETGIERGQAVGVVPFRYPDEPECESDVPVTTAASALSEIVNWSCDGQDPSMCAARIFTVQTWLDPVHAKFKSLSQIGTACGVSRASLSKALLIFKDSHAIRMSIGRLQSSRAVYSEAQRFSVANGTHCSFSRKNANLNTNSDTMDYSVKDRYPTLDRATDRIAELESKLSEVKESKTAPVTPVHASVPRPTPPIEALTASELEQAMRLANKQGNGDLLKALLREWHRRK